MIQWIMVLLILLTILCKIQLLTLRCHTTDPPMTKVSVGLQKGHKSTERPEVVIWSSRFKLYNLSISHLTEAVPVQKSCKQNQTLDTWNATSPCVVTARRAEVICRLWPVIVRSPTDTLVQSETYDVTRSNSRVVESVLSYLNQDIDHWD